MTSTYCSECATLRAGFNDPNAKCGKCPETCQDCAEMQAYHKNLDAKCGVHYTVPVKPAPAQEPQQPPPTEFLLQFFAYAHLPENLQVVSKPFGELVTLMLRTLPRNAERMVMLRKLLEAKDCAVRARVAKP